MTGQQDIQSFFLSGSSRGSPIEVNSTSKSAPTIVHVTENGALLYQHSVFLKAVNSSNASVLLHLHWNPTADSDAGIDDVTFTYEIPEYSDFWIAQGERVGGTHFTASNARAGITARVESGDTNKIRLTGWANRIEQPGV